MSVTEMRPAAAPDKIPTADELVGRARALAPKLRERAVKAERDRNLGTSAFAKAMHCAVYLRAWWRSASRLDWLAAKDFRSMPA